MAKVYLICGKLCCGKTTYAKRLRQAKNAVILSVDEIMLAVFGPFAGEKHDEYARRVRGHLFQKSLEIVGAGVSVVLDWGFWTREARDGAKEFYRSHGVECEMHYIDVDDAEWSDRIARRNRLVDEGGTEAYPVDVNLAAKFKSIFEPPEDNEIDVRVREA